MSATRREAIAWLGFAALAGRAAASPSARKVSPVGLQLYTVRKAMAADPEQTLSRVAAVGYREVEFAGYFGHSAADVRGLLARTGLRAPSAHISSEKLADGWERTLEEAHTIGHRYLIVASAHHASTLDDYRQLAERLNRAGERAARMGVRVGFHNHDVEFRAIDGKRPYDVLLEATDPKWVCFEMDLYWIVKGGQDPLAYFARWPGRIELVHVKDAAGPAKSIVPVGAGSIDWANIFSHAKGIKHYFVEDDDASDPFASLTASYAYLRDLRY